LYRWSGLQSAVGVGPIVVQNSRYGFKIMKKLPSRRTLLNAIPSLAGAGLLGGVSCSSASAAKNKQTWDKAIDKGLRWVSRIQSRRGHWTAGNYPTAMTALAGCALLCSGSTSTQGPYARNIRRAVDYLISHKARGNGLIGDPKSDSRYTYGHGFAMLFLSQVVGEEEDQERRSELLEILNRAVTFSGQAQTKSGGWGYVSAKDGNDFDEGSTTITQVQGLRGCRNAGVVVASETIEKAKQYIYGCQNKDGGISYSSRNRGSSRPAITAAALASLYSAGDYDSEHVPKMQEYCKKHLYRVTDGSRAFGHWHYTYHYYGQVVYRDGGKIWESFRDRLYDRIVSEQNSASGEWTGNIGPIYVTALSLIMLQLDKGYLPIFQR